MHSELWIGWWFVDAHISSFPHNCYKLELASWYYGLIYNQIWFTYALIEIKFLGFDDWNIDMHAHFPNKFDPCSLKIMVILSLDYPLVSILIFIDVAIFNKYATLLAFEKKNY